MLFVIALLAILATAIAAASGTFAANSGPETNRTNAAAMIQIGQTLKMGVDRLMSRGNSMYAIDLNEANTSANNALFAPGGGGLIPPAVTLSSNPASDAWIYTWGAIPNLGSGSEERLALLKVTQGVCDQVNVQGASLPSGAPNSTALGNFNTTTNVTTTNWPSGLNGKMLGCFNNSSGASGTYFYQVLAIQ
ncbi:MAG TPA: hypothetical protein VHB73_05440 [Alphaproteobacteria bacterium]|nr:hypothetical protein [Alphaproteobacteria bacterium]